MSDRPNDQEPRIIVDDDWKAQVERERQAESERPQSSEEQRELPPPSMAFLFSTLATQAMFALGLIVEQGQQPPQPDCEMARHFIDTLDLLEQKTQGNLDPEETQMLSNTLHELRMLYAHFCSKQTSVVQPASGIQLA